MSVARNIFVVGLVLLFAWSIYQSWKKYQMGRELTFTQFRNVKSLQYPSVTVCKNQMYDTTIDDELFDNKSIDISQKKKLFNKHILELNETIYFLNHPNILDLKFPCLTTGESVSPNQPCAFPFKYDDFRSNKYETLRYNCTKLGADKPWCYTQVSEDRVRSSEKGSGWGYCSETCLGDLFLPERESNLGGRSHSSLWTSGVSDLRSSKTGYCHTYNPPHDSQLGVENSIGMYLGVRDRRPHDLFGFFVYFHEKNQFWPDADFPGQQELIVTPDTSYKVSFSITELSKLSDSLDPCTDKQDHSITSCLQEFIIKKVGCRLGFVDDQGSRPCTSQEDINQHQRLFTWIKRSTWSNISSQTGCIAKCISTWYSYNVIQEESMDWDVDWISELFIIPKTSTVERREELLAFDFGDLLGDLGGLLGLFLGWSLLSLFDILFTVGVNLFTRFKRSTAAK